MSMDSTAAYVADVLAQNDELKAEYQVELNDPAWLAEQKTTNRRVEILKELKERDATMLAYLDKVTKERAERAAAASSSKRELPNDADSTEPKPKRFKIAVDFVEKVKAKTITRRR
ncbi:C2H2-type domain-containing protein [Mycena chlorophos]|uniref:C2H2-type domain-containing protein n=1 Tax=Mycena chlorophos TaxID=658473 RepID=A0A8H6TUU4_MYCCL|nr:C2H2-type domain-containing protein [Mycena chlorophos]